MNVSKEFMLTKKKTNPKHQPTDTQALLLQALIQGVAQAHDVEGAFEAVLKIVCQQSPNEQNQREQASSNAARSNQQRLKQQRQHKRWCGAEVWQIDEETNTLLKHLSWCVTPKGCFDAGASMPERLWVSQQAEWHADITHLSETILPQVQLAITKGIKAMLGVPLVVNERTLAVLVFFSRETIPEDPQLVESVQAMSAVIALLAGQRLPLVEEKFIQEKKLAVQKKLAQGEKHGQVEKLADAEKLAQAQDLDRITLNSIGDAVMTTDAVGRVQYLNPVAEQLTGWTQMEAYNKPVSEIFKIISPSISPSISPTLDKSLINPVEQMLRSRQAIQRDQHVILVTRSGHKLAVEHSVAPIQTGKNQTNKDPLIGAVIVFHDVSNTQPLTQQLSWQASHDILTGLVNRQKFELCLRQAVDNAHTHQKVHTLCYIDLDNFKIVNDTCGHTAGDKLLKQISAFLMSHIRMTDTLARLGGDEFGLLLRDCPPDPAQHVVVNLREKLKAFKFIYEGRAFTVGISVGVTTITAETKSAETALSDADAACYLAKRKGRNRTHFHHGNDLDLAQQRDEIHWAAYITEALETGKFQLYQQPILSLNPACSKGEHYEVLLRLHDPLGQLVSPNVFMPAAERYDLMPLIDRWVVSTLFSAQSSCYQQIWQQSKIQPDFGNHLYSVNLSGASINDDDFMDFLQEQFEVYNIPPALICFEITETAAIANLDKAAQFITKFRQLGCQFALDDFGSGMSSFAYLKTLPIDYLKIDGHFIKSIVGNKIDTAMVTAIHQIAQVMNIQTVAEFVENDATLQTVRNLGINYAQGYGISRPKPMLSPAR